jgi:hypothetical protein
MDIFTNIARRMDSDKLECLARFRAAAKAHESLPAGIYELPHGFLAGVGFNDDLRALYVLTPLGMRVAMAAEKLAEETVKLTDAQWDALINAHDQGLSEDSMDELIRLNVEEAKESA